MGYCLLIQEKVLFEGDTIGFFFSDSKIDLTAEIGPEDATAEAKILKIDVESQSVDMSFDVDPSQVTNISIHIWPGASIIKKEELTDPNILFKTRPKK